MDDLKRVNARSKIENAQRLKRRLAAKHQIIEELSQGINLYLQIVKKNFDDYYEIADAYYEIAIIYFNDHNYVKAGETYLNAIKQLLLQSELNDKIYRRLTALYIDLADACYEMMNQHAGDEAMANAIKAFKLIEIKNLEEAGIGDPVVNFERFHAYHEKKLSTDSYRKSSKFLNHKFLLGEGQCAREEQTLFKQFDSISIGERRQIDQSIENMLSQLSLSADQPLFSQVLINQSPSDNAYRGMAMQLLRLAQIHIQKQSISDAIATYNQVIKTLHTIKKPNKDDLQIIQDLTEQIKFLKAKPQQEKNKAVSVQAPQRSDHYSSPVAHTMGFLTSRNEPVANHSDTMEMDDNEMSFN